MSWISRLYTVLVVGGVAASGCEPETTDDGADTAAPSGTTGGDPTGEQTSAATSDAATSSTPTPTTDADTGSMTDSGPSATTDAAENTASEESGPGAESSGGETQTTTGDMCCPDECWFEPCECTDGSCCWLEPHAPGCCEPPQDPPDGG